MQLSLIPKSQQEKNRNALLLSLKKKRALLEKLVVRSEMLKVRLDMLKSEYMVKIGSLVLKDNHLDLEIIQKRNLLHLLKEGKSYEEALKELSTTFYAEQLEIEKEEEKIRIAEEKLEKQQSQQSEEVIKEAKKLWKKLIALFHPDLTQDNAEKKRREAIMKDINQAYEEGDFLRLAKIEREKTLTGESATENLEEALVLLEREIFEQEKFYLELKQSDWYRWDLKITKSKLTISDIFKDLEKKLLDDIVAKIEINNALTDEIERAKVDK